MKLLSVIVPIYNLNTFLPICLDSLIRQTYKNLEIILINDGSTDNSGEICNKYAERDSRIKVIHQNNQGVSAARNAGLDLSKGNYITFVDGDDWCDKDYFEKSVKVFEENNDVNVVITNFSRDYADKKKHVKVINSNGFILNNYEAINNMIDRKNFGWEVYSTFYKYDIVKNVRFSLENVYGEDFDFKYRVFRNKKLKVFYLPIVGYHYVSRGNSAVNSYDLKKKMNSLEFQEQLIREEKEERFVILLKKKYLNALLYYYIKFLIQGIDNYNIKNKIDNLVADISFYSKLSVFLKIKIFTYKNIFRYIKLIFRFRKIIYLR